MMTSGAMTAGVNLKVQGSLNDELSWKLYLITKPRGTDSLRQRGRQDRSQAHRGADRLEDTQTNRQIDRQACRESDTNTYR